MNEEHIRKDRLNVKVLLNKEPPSSVKNYTLTTNIISGINRTNVMLSSCRNLVKNVDRSGIYWPTRGNIDPH